MTSRHRLLVSFAISIAVGYLSLSQEMVWIRLIAYASRGSAAVFGHVLGVVLTGIAAGALAGKAVSERIGSASTRPIGIALVAGFAIYVVSIPAAAWLMTHAPAAGLLAAYAAAGLSAAFTGAVLPMLCDYGVPRDRAAGVPLSRIYMANIIGATAGPLVTGFVLFDLVPVATLAVWLGAAGVLIGSLLLALARDRLATAVSLAALALIPAVSLAFYGDLLERLHYKAEYQTRGAYTMTVETRTGIVAVEETPLDDIVYGGGFYDGGFNLDPVLDVNGITRPYMATAVHEAPADVLMIGLGSGSWTIATLASPRVRHLTVVELNRAHAEVIKQHPTHAALLSDPRLEVVIDDGRRWLQRHPDRRFDLVIMNTVLFWRNLSTNVLSHEFFTLVRSRLRDGGAVWFNGTGYDGSIFTVAHAFRHVTRFDSMVGASDRSFEASPLARRTHLWQFRLGDAPVFRVDDAGSRAVVERLASADLPDVAPAYRARSDLLLTTDDNMAPEYKDGLASLRSLFNRDKRWSVLWNSD